MQLQWTDALLGNPERFDMIDQNITKNGTAQPEFEAAQLSGFQKIQKSRLCIYLKR